jgi:outer membrane protein OmpA-like peptidoglycan-associated protein
MRKTLLGAGIALAVALSWAGAQAQLLVAPSGPGAWYFGGEGGWTSLSSPEVGKHLGFNWRQNFSDGFNIGARGGYEWGPWRFEEEFRFQQTGITSAKLDGGATVPMNGNRNAYAIMTNAIYDIPVGWAISPHIGAGVGAVVLHDGMGVRSGPFKFTGNQVNNDDIVFGYQAIGGIRYNINPTLAFDVDYRYLATDTPTLHIKKAVPFGIGPYTSGYESHSVVASLTLRFGAPPPVVAPPAPPAPPPAIRKVFLVFFDWDKDTITPEGMQIIQQAAAAFRAGAPVTIQVTGYTDRSGSPGYNQRLSERRANNVANALARMGVPRSQMAVSGRGENDNRVPTADGVREPQNRRVEIVFP